jgi:hypothetical protein
MRLVYACRWASERERERERLCCAVICCAALRCAALRL